MKLKQLQTGKWLRQAVIATGLGLAMLVQLPSYAASVNSASMELLQTVNGIGPARAKAIIEERERNGPFVSGEDLATRVRGISDKTVEKMALAGLTVEPSVQISRARSAKFK